MSLLDVLRGVMLDPAEQAAYSADPAAYLGRFGYDDVDPADLSEAFGLVADTLPPDQAQAAWEAASTPEGDAFGTVTADFDAEAGPEEEPDAFGAGPAFGEDPALGEEPVLDATLSFGHGEAADGPPAPDAVVPDPDEGSPGDGAGGTSAEDGGAGLDDDFAGGLDDGGPDDGGLGDLDGGPGGGLDEPDDAYDEGGLDDDFGDLDRIDGLDDLSLPGPDDTDIGSF